MSGKPLPEFAATATNSRRSCGDVGVARLAVLARHGDGGLTTYN